VLSFAFHLFVRLHTNKGSHGTEEATVVLCAACGMLCRHLNGARRRAWQPINAILEKRRERLLLAFDAAW
jgi:hypothetical protein